MIERGDANNRLKAWRLNGYTDANTDGGRLYVSTTSGGVVSLFSDYSRQDKVAEGTGATVGSVLALVQVSSSGLSGSVYVAALADNSAIDLWPYLVSEEKIQRSEEESPHLLLVNRGDGTAEATFQAIHERVFETLRRKLQDRVRPKDPEPRAREQYDPRIGAFSETPAAVTTGLWSRDHEGQWEITGLANPRDFREWALSMTRSYLWERRARGSDSTGLEHAVYHRERAEEIWSETQVFVDDDADLQPDHEVGGSITIEIRRG